ncbi:KUP system potassium uptake protein [Rhizobium sp. SG_E_25_P2]|uniref:potassium transporter Kup n=1 Tax=Rhizobium sp. SG_E_25_P2 TaxID=2879942 RepID=UPI002475BE9F|nr:potassium transporter Kup [Rhizobium sp. SG_E_25_P2]MDH6268459.1 KUP system potassium uptake protein [Rhizobium sp. SG_E_25_P2]
MHAPTSQPGSPPKLGRLLALSLGSIGVVYGDIGTSPLYAFREALRPVAGDGVTSDEVIGIISLMLWTLTIIVTVKYVVFLLRADNKGEGGTLSLLALLSSKLEGRHGRVLVLLGLIGAALFIGDAMITPALSVMSAVEGMKFVAPDLTRFVLPVSVVILIALFAVQSRGTGAVSKAFGPITLVWFAALAAAGVAHIADDPRIFAALNPINAVTFLIHGGFSALIVLGAVFLTVTGAEALYADLGHFGRKPIQLAWLAVVYPALTLNYLGQGAFVLSDARAIEDPFYLMFPEWSLIPVILLATAATIIASQAVITGAFSLVSQAIHLGFLPRMDIHHTSHTDTGQIYLPMVNTFLLFGVMMLVLIFQTSESLATAYGISVTGAMVVTTIMFFDFLRIEWKWSLGAALSLVAPLAVLELVFLGANLIKIHDGGYVPIAIAGLVVLVMWTWRRGSSIVSDKSRRSHVALRSFVKSVEKESAHGPHPIPGCGIFLTSEPEATPSALLHNIKHNRVLHQQNIILTIRTDAAPTVPASERGKMERISERFSILTLTFGFMDTPNVSQALAQMRKEGLKFDIMSTTFFVGRRKLVSDPNSGMPAWQDRLFIGLAGMGTDPSDYFRLPANRVIELGSHVSV